MQKAGASFFATYLSGLKPFVLASVGAVTTASAVFAMVSQAGNAVPIIFRILDLPACRYSDVYRGTQTDFVKEGSVWREYPVGAVTHRFEFKEIRRDRDEIMLRNLTPRETQDWATLTVHIPVCDGTAKMSEGMPEHWTDLQRIWPAPRES